MVAAALPLTLTGALAVQMRADLDFSAADLGAGVLAYFGVGALASAPGGRAAQRLRTVTSLRASAAVSAASMLGIAAARSWPQVLGILAFAGVGASLSQPACNALLVRAGRPERRGLAFGINQSSIPASTLLGGVAVPALALTVGWRAAFAAAAASALLAVCALTPRSAPWAAPPTPQEPHGAEDRDTDPAPPPTSWRQSMALIAIAGAFGSGAYNALGAFGVSSGVAAGLAPGTAGILHAVASLSSICVRVLAGWLAGRRAPARGTASDFTLVAVMQVAGAAGLTLIAVGTTATFVPGALLAYGIGWGVAGLYNFAISRRYQAHAARATGAIHVGVYAGAGLAPALFGQLASGLSLPVAWLAMAACSLVSTALLLTLAHADRTRATRPAEASA